MRKFLVFDTDNSMASIGGREEQKEIFGFPSQRVQHGVTQLMQLLGPLVEVVQKPLDPELVALYGDAAGGTEPVLTFKKAVKDMGIQGIIVDTISTLAFQTRAEIMNAKKVKSMSLPLWGEFGDLFMRFINTIGNADFHVIATCHASRDKDENGGPIEIPGVKGSSKDEVPRFFDVVGYTQVSRKRGTDDHSTYSWIMEPDPRRTYAKNRLASLGPVIDQNYDAILSQYEEKGRTAKILIIGDSGQGKTTSLKTINP